MTENSIPTLFVPLSEYKIPPKSIKETLKKNFFALLFSAKLGEQEKTNEILSSPLFPKKEWHEILEQEADLNALEEFVAQETSRPDSSPVLFYVYQPFCASSRLLEKLANKKEYETLCHEDFSHSSLETLEEQLEQWRRSSKTLIIPHLEKFFLRHPSCLGAVRLLLEFARKEKKKKIVMGCNSWAWEYLHALSPGKKDNVWTQNAGTPSEIEEMVFSYLKEKGFSSFEIGNSNLSECLFDSAWEASAGENQEENKKEKWSLFLQNLLSFCNGNKQVTLDLCLSLLSQVQTSPEEKTADKAKLLIQDPLSFWGIDLKKELLSSHAMVIHSILLHGEMNISELCKTLFFSPNKVKDILLNLEDLRVVYEKDEHWDLLFFSYPFVREYLDGEGYFTGKIGK